MSSEELPTFAQALSEAKQYIVDQSHRIRSDAEKIKKQQQTIVDQCAAISDGERRNREQAARLTQVESEGETLKGRLADETSARHQAEGVCDRQGERVTLLQQSIAELEKTVLEQAQALLQLTRERDALRVQVPTSEDTTALAELESLLTRRVGPSADAQADGLSSLEVAA